MRKKGFLRTLQGIAESYVLVFKKLSAFILFIIIAAGTSCIIAYPIWLFASKLKNVFSVTMLILLCSVIILTVVQRIRHRRKQKSIFLNDKKKNSKRVKFLAFGIPGLLIGCYSAVVAFSLSLRGLGIILSAAIIVFFGYFLNGIKKAY